MSLMTFASRNAIFSVPIVVTYFNSFGTMVKSETLKVGKFERLYAGGIDEVSDLDSVRDGVIVHETAVVVGHSARGDLSNSEGLQHAPEGHE